MYNLSVVLTNNEKVVQTLDEYPDITFDGGFTCIEINESGNRDVKYIRSDLIHTMKILEIPVVSEPVLQAEEIAE